MNDSNPLPYLEWTPKQASQFGLVAQSTRHHVHKLTLWDDDGLVKLIDAQPCTQLRVLQSGTDPMHQQRDHQPVDTEGASGADILAAVKRARLSVNMQRIDLAQPCFDQLGRQLYAELLSGAPHFVPVWSNRALLLVSSPSAMVYLHADYQPNTLWHLRGTKTI